MSHNKKDLQIICNVQWKTKPANGGNRVSIVVGFCDMPATTLSWEHFKSYLLTNAGVSEGFDDIRVLYSNDNREIAIQSQIDFQIALYTFRRLARNGEMINITLDRVTDHASKWLPDSMGENSKVRYEVEEPQATAIVGTTATAPDWFTNYIESSTPPKWFTEYMQTFKKDLLDEVNTNVLSLKAHMTSQLPTRKPKTESKRLKVKEKDTTKMERKLETKLEKLETKTKRIKEKKMALCAKSSDSDAGCSSKEVPARSEEPAEDAVFTAIPKESSISEQDSAQLSDDDCYEQFKYHGVAIGKPKVAHVTKGEFYVHTWDVCNDGSMPWDNETEFRFTWGSKSLYPVETAFPCPHLQPGEIGKISVQLIASTPGNYECYWHLYHRKKRFGDWFGCQVTVVEDEFPVTNKSQYENAACALETALKNDTVLVADPNLAEPSTANENKLHILNVEEETKQQTEQINSEESTAVLVDLSDDDSIQHVKKQDSDDDISDADAYVYLSDQDLQKVNVKIQIENTMEEKVEELTVQNGESMETPDNKDDAVNVKEDDDNNNVASCDSSSDSSSFEKVDVEENYVKETVVATEELDDSKKANEQDKDMVYISLEKETNSTQGFAYVVVDGQKIRVPKKFLRKDYLETAEEAPSSPTVSEEISTQTCESSDSCTTVIITKAEQTQIPEKKPAEDDAVSHMKKDETPAKNEDNDDDITVDCAGPTKVTRKHVSEHPLTKNQSPKIEKVQVTEHPLADNRRFGPSEEHVQVTSSFKEDGINSSSSETLRCESCDCSLNNSNSVNSYMSHCSATGSCFSEPNNTRLPSSRLFIFPPDAPGYEVVSSQSCHSTLNMDGSQYGSAQMFHPVDFQGDYQQDALLTPPLSHCNHTVFPHVPNYQQTHPIHRQQAPSQQLHHSTPQVFDDGKVPTRQAPFYPSVFVGMSDGTCISQQPMHQHENVYEVFNNAASSYVNTPPPAAQMQQQPPQGSGDHSPPTAPTVHILPETLVSGAVNVASSAINTARSVINMIVPPRQEPGRWVNGHWVTINPETPREANLRALAEMGFYNRDLNATLLARYNDDLVRVISELIQ